MWGGGEARTTDEAESCWWREGASVKDGRKKQPRTWGLTMSLAAPGLCSEVVDGVTRIIVCLFREPDAGKLPVQFDEREQETEPSPTGLRRRRESFVSSHRQTTRHCACSRLYSSHTPKITKKNAHACVITDCNSWRDCIRSSRLFLRNSQLGAARVSYRLTTRKANCDQHSRVRDRARSASTQRPANYRPRISQSLTADPFHGGGTRHTCNPCGMESIFSPMCILQAKWDASRP